MGTSFTPCPSQWQFGGVGGYQGNCWAGLATASGADTITYTYGNFTSASTGTLAIQEWSGISSATSDTSAQTIITAAYSNSVSVPLTTSQPNDLIIQIASGNHTVDASYSSQYYRPAGNAQNVFNYLSDLLIAESYQVMPVTGMQIFSMAHQDNNQVQLSYAVAYKASTTASVTCGGPQTGNIYINSAVTPFANKFVCNGSSWIPF